ncbi:MAG TPA: PKD domain-containing protein [Pirellulaceae bacterium]|nr:PKD domain-containing protein [Pirellulaceae bacterium]
MTNYSHAFLTIALSCIASAICPAAEGPAAIAPLVRVVDLNLGESAEIVSLHPNYYPTQGIRPGDAVTFKVRTFNTTAGKETWDFGDGSAKVEVQSDGNAVKLAPDGYAVTTHRYDKPGDYVVRVARTNEQGVAAVAHLHVYVR